MWVVEREEIRPGSERGETCSVIAAHLGRATSTISEGGGEERWSESPPRTSRGHTGALVGVRRRSKVAKLVARAKLRATAQRWLGERASPEQIAKQLRARHTARGGARTCPDDGAPSCDR